MTKDSFVHKTIITPTPQFESNITLKGSVKQKSAKFWSNSESNSIEAEGKEETNSIEVEGKEEAL